ncbi:helix-turn-helix domain-containing protein [Pelagicoccus sp. SDUM812005]|uniref:helix-turn-helix domain-containing protein n=1 Tax=Pelagicoccus sp. SDUM812005 TaxID=3041257 RepID=UPI00280EE068|nr:helix-turn-helix domain-containing protein [Pelagicoccus sp. SDUM812005]MDQ8179853.1 helix-turn-helix domain-containing protein [Pelagicoccus sp. SDUM812005]
MPRKRAKQAAASLELATPEESRELTKSIGATRLFAKYERSFTAASGLPLTLRPIGTFRMPATGHRKENPFCALVSTARKGCLACLMAQSELEKNASRKASTLHCFAGLHDTLVPIRMGHRIIAYLQTGQVALEALDNSHYDRAHSEMILRGIELDSQAARKAYRQSVSLDRDAYQGFVKMLEIFAESLGAAANTLHLAKAEKSGNPAALKAVRHIRQHSDRPISLSEIARIAGASVRHFSKVFKEETGLTFVDYLTRERVERAKERISQSSDRISDIAFASGFDSIAQFNRAFKKVAGESPSSYRLSANG